MDDFLIRALIIGSIVALTVGPIGCFIVWRRMAYFGDTMSHSALLGAIFGLLIGISPFYGVLLTSFTLAIILFFAQKQKVIAVDTLLGIMAHGSLASGIILVSAMENMRLDLMGYLFGDILSVSDQDIILTMGGAICLLIILLCIWRPLIAITINETLARSEGLPVDRIRITYMLLIAAVIALSVQIVGMLLITALLIIPAAAARRFANSPEQMAFYASVAGIASVALGLYASYSWDFPSGPAIVVSSCALFLASIVATPRLSVR